MSEFKSGITTTSVQHGWIATLHHGDGSSTDYWAPTEGGARDRAQNGADQ